MASVSKAAAESRHALIDELVRGGPNLTFAGACDLNAAEFAERDALIDRATRLNWADVKTISDRLAQAMLERGVMRPDIVLIHLSNSAEQFLIRLACEKAGVRVVLTNSSFRETELASIIERAEPRIAFVTAFRAARGDYDRLREVLAERGVGLDFVVVGGGSGVAWGETYEAFLAAAPSAPCEGLLDRTRFGWGERFYLTTTSGSTSAPKIADTIYGNRIWLSLRHAAGVKLALGETIAALPPMTSGTSDSLIHHAAPYFAATIVVEPRFDAVETCDLLVAEGVHVATAVPTMLARMVAGGVIDRLADAPLRCFATYASSISYELARSVEQRARCGIVRCYGTMDFGGISMSTLDDDREARIRSVGKPFPDNDVKIVGQHGEEMPPGAEGEIVMRPSRIVMGGGYYRDVEKTIDAWRGEYYRLGDLGVLDEDGNLVLVGRASELIIRGGQNVVPAEVEELMITHPKVIDVTVVGLPDDEMGERICACVILEDGQSLELDETREHFRALGVALFKCPERIVAFDEFPPAMSGMKVDRRRLVDMLTAE
jgi:acyl-coenzyme A synthetase/AMP-(fatty) acid ligase